MTLNTCKVKLVVSDHWDFGPGPFFEIVLYSKDSDPDQLLFRLDCSVLYKGVMCEYFVVSARGDEKDILSALSQGGRVDCNLTVISEDHATGLDPFDLTLWRGGCALIGSLEK